MHHVSLTQKIHELAFDVSCFVKEHETVGFLGEEEGESIHHAINLKGAQVVGSAEGFTVKNSDQVA